MMLPGACVMTESSERLADLRERFESLSRRLRKIAVSYVDEVVAAGHPPSAVCCIDLTEEIMVRHLGRLERIGAVGGGLGRSGEALAGFMSELETAILSTEADLRRLEAAAPLVEAALAQVPGRSRSLH